MDSLNSLLCGGQLSAVGQDADRQLRRQYRELPLHHPDLHADARPRPRRGASHPHLARLHHPEIALWKRTSASALSRREFIRQAACAAVGTAAMTCAIRDLRFMNAAVAQSNITDYKALVCIFLAGGNDSNNLIIPTIASEYNNYAAIRTPVLALPQCITAADLSLEQRWPQLWLAPLLPAASDPLRPRASSPSSSTPARSFTP